MAIKLVGSLNTPNNSELNTLRSNEIRRRNIPRKLKKFDESNEHIVIVNGEEKRIRKQSKYLIDMLSLDD